MFDVKVQSYINICCKVKTLVRIYSMHSVIYVVKILNILKM
jgi:hypothetical protein